MQPTEDNKTMTLDPDVVQLGFALRRRLSKFCRLRSSAPNSLPLSRVRKLMRYHLHRASIIRFPTFEIDVIICDCDL